ncbi:MAG: LuxR family transcriptional regulator [Pseudomonadota bacterium]
MRDTIHETTESPFIAGGDLADVSRDLTDYAESLGARYFSYLLMKGGRGEETGDEGTLITNYPDEWRDRYQRKLYRFYDPVAVTTRSSRLPFFWGDGPFLRRFRKDQRIVFHEARQFDITAGYSIPIAGHHGDLGVFSIVAGRPQEIDDAVLGAGGSLYLRAVQTHDFMARLLAPFDPPEKDFGLSVREIECLRWTADGKTTDQIADVTTISPATVNFHLKNAIRKLEASNRHHAAIIAIRSGVI